MAEPQQVIPGEMSAPSAAQPDAGGPSQDQAQQVADMIAKAMGDIMDKMKKVLDALKVMGVPDEVLSQAADAGDAFTSSVQSALGLDQGAPEEGAEGPVPQEAGVNGKPAV